MLFDASLPETAFAPANLHRFIALLAVGVTSVVASLWVTRRSPISLITARE